MLQKTTTTVSQDYYKHRKKLISGGVNSVSSLDKLSPIRRAFRAILGLGVMKLSLAAVLPLALFAARYRYTSSLILISQRIL